MSPKMVSAQAGQLDPSFNSADHGVATVEGANNDVRTLAIQPDGNIILAGLFTSFNGSVVNGIVRIKTNGSTDAGFNTGGSGFTGIPYKVLLQPDGKIIVAGKFSSYNGITANNIIRLNTDGSKDAGFNIGTGFNDSVEVIKLQPDGKILVGGNFTLYNGVASSFAIRLNSDGTKDASFAPVGITTTVHDIGLQADGNILVGQESTPFIRLTSSGASDPTLIYPGPVSSINAVVHDIQVQPDGKILIAGYANSTAPGMGGFAYFTRINSNGSIDAGFTPPTLYTGINAIALQPDGKILIAFGKFQERFTDLEGKKIQRLNTDGTVDPTFNYYFNIYLNQNVFALAIQPDGKIVSAESLKWQVSFRASYGAYYAGARDFKLKRYNSDGSADNDFLINSNATGSSRIVWATAVQSDGKVLVGGYFYTFNGVQTNHIVRLNTDGTVDPTFNIGSGFNEVVKSIAIQPDGKIVVGGYFTQYNGQSFRTIVRLNPNGSVDPTFTPASTYWAYVNAIFIQTDGRIFVGGSVEGAANCLNADGSKNTTFTSRLAIRQLYSYPELKTLAVQPDGNIVVGGYFDHLGGNGINPGSFSESGIARVRPDGYRDTTFNGRILDDNGELANLGAGGIVNAIVLQADGKIIAGGDFTSYKTYNTSTVVNRIMRLTNRGIVDPTFNAGGSGFNGGVYSITLLPGGKLLVSGGFTTYNGTAVASLIRLNADGTLDNTFNGGSGANSNIYSVAVENGSARLYISGEFTSYNTAGKNRVARIFNDDAGAPIDCTIGNIAGPDRACQYITAGTNAVYQITAPTGSTITWTVSAASTMSIVSGQGTNQVNVHFANNFTSGAVKAHVVSATCSLNVTRSLTVKITVPSAPGAITASNSGICSVLGTPNTITYSIAKVSSASSYIWTAQAGTTTITHPNGAGVNDTTITVAFSAGFTNSAITVQAVNDCGTSSVRSLNVTRNNPGTPSTISGPVYVCDYRLPSATTAAVYSITAVAGVTYNWTVPAGATSVTGQGTNSISFFYPAGFTTGAVSVTASNGCGTSTARSLSVKASAAGTPGAIYIISVSNCPRIYTYYINSIPVNATSVAWTAPAGGIITSGQGTTSVTISYPSGTINGYVSVHAYNTCGASSVRKIGIQLSECPPAAPFAKGEVNAPTATANTTQPIAKSTLQIPAVEGMDVKVFPNPSVNDFNLQVITSGKEVINVRVFDVAGRFISEHTMYANETAKLGAALKTGTYIIEVRQGNNVKTTRVIKF
ncbi:MAG: T9SS type A sorting domain-containing protein [Ferruginibacter sp.]